MDTGNGRVIVAGGGGDEKGWVEVEEGKGGINGDGKEHNKIL